MPKKPTAENHIQIKPRSRLAIYQQIAQQLRAQIRSGHLHEGEKLLSSRKLALRLNVSRTSTLNAYEMLVSEGLITTRPKSGVFVTALAQAKPDSQEDEVSTKPGDFHGEHLKAKYNAIFDYGPDMEQFPFPDWSRCLAKSWRQPDPVLLRERLPGGYWPLRLAIAQYLKSTRGLQCLPDQVIITAGSQDATTLINHVINESCAPIALENPCYLPLCHMLQSYGNEIEYCEVDREGMKLPTRKVKLAWMTPAHQYPLGSIQSIERRLQWLEYSRRMQCWIIEDDFDSEFHYRKPVMSTLYGMATPNQAEQQHRGILIGSFSKSMFRTLRIGYLIVPLRVVEAFLYAQEDLGIIPSVLVQPALAEFISQKRFLSHLRRMRRIYQQRRDTLFTQVEHYLQPWIETSLPNNGMYLLARLRASVKKQDRWLAEQLATEGIRVDALSPHYHQGGAQGLLLGYSSSSEKQMRKGVKILARLLR